MLDFLIRTLQGDLLAVEVKLNRQQLEAFVAPVSLKQVADAADVQSPTALSHLRRLEEEGRIAKVQTPEGPRYAVLPFVQIEWQDPKANTNLKWTSNSPIDWRFPLVSRVPDKPAQDMLLRWLDLMLSKGQLPAIRPKSSDPATKAAPRVDFVVYGSCARGDATARSDLDLLVVGEVSKRQAEQFIDAAHEASLGTGRSPDIRAMNLQDWQKAESSLRQTIQKEGLTVYSTDPNDPLITGVAP